MEQTGFEQVAASFGAFHMEFAPLFGRVEAQRRSEQYLRGLLVQQADRRNAENVAALIEGATPRPLQRLLRGALADGASDRPPARLRGGAPEHAGRRLCDRRERLPQARDYVGGGGAAVLRDAGQGDRGATGAREGAHLAHTLPLAGRHRRADQQSAAGLRAESLCRSRPRRHRTARRLGRDRQQPAPHRPGPGRLSRETGGEGAMDPDQTPRVPS